MRHLIGFFLAIVVAAALFFGATWGLTQLASLAAHGTSLLAATGVIALSVLGGTGLLLGIVIAVRAVSPLAPGLPGLVLLAWSALLAVRAHQALRWIPLQGHPYGAEFRTLLVSGMLALLGAAMIVPLFIPGRWRRAHGQDDEIPESGLAAAGLLAEPVAPTVPGVTIVPGGAEQADLSGPR